MSAQSLCGTLTLTPPTASIRSSKPVKSTIATWSIWMSRKSSTASICGLGAAEGVGGVDFLRALAGDFGVAVARDREFAEGAAAGADQHQRVGAEFADFEQPSCGASPCGLLFEALLRGGGAGLLGVRRPGVGAEHEDRLRAGQQQRVAVQGVLRFAGELEGLQLGGDGEGEEAEQDPAERRDPDPLEHPLAGPAARRPGLPLGLGPRALLAPPPFRRARRPLSESREIGGPQPRQKALPGPVDLVLGRPGGLLLAIVGHERLRESCRCPRSPASRPLRSSHECRGNHRRRPGRDEDAARRPRRRLQGALGEPRGLDRADRGRAGRPAGARGRRGAPALPGRGRHRARHPGDDRPRPRRRGLRRQPAARGPADPRSRRRAHRPAGLRRQRRQRRRPSPSTSTAPRAGRGTR